MDLQTQTYPVYILLPRLRARGPTVQVGRRPRGIREETYDLDQWDWGVLLALDPYDQRFT